MDNEINYKVLFDIQDSKVFALINMISASLTKVTKATSSLVATAMNQFKVSTEAPISSGETLSEIMNVMALAAKKGSATLPAVKMALEQSGMAAKAANVSLAETNAAILMLDSAGKKGTEGGIALRDVLTGLSQSSFLPESVVTALNTAGVQMNDLNNHTLTLAERMKSIQNIMFDTTLMTSLFGESIRFSAQILLSSITQIQQLSTVMEANRLAYEQTNTAMSGTEAYQKQIMDNVESFKTEILTSTFGLVGYGTALGSIFTDLGELAKVYDTASEAIKFMIAQNKIQALWTTITTKATATWAIVQNALNYSFLGCPIIVIILAIIALIAAIVYVVNHTVGWGKAWELTVQGAKDLWSAFTTYMGLKFQSAIASMMNGLDLIRAAWYQFRAGVGIGDADENQAALAQIQKNVEARTKAIRAGEAEVVRLTGSAINNFRQAGAAVKWVDEKEVPGEKRKPANTVNQTIKNNIPGLAAPSSPSSGLLKTEGKKTNDNITTGGSKSTTVNISIGNLVKDMKITAATIQESAGNIRDIVIDELTRAVAMGGALGGN